MPHSLGRHRGTRGGCAVFPAAMPVLDSMHSIQIDAICAVQHVALCPQAHCHAKGPVSGCVLCVMCYRMSSTHSRRSTGSITAPTGSRKQQRRTAAKQQQQQQAHSNRSSSSSRRPGHEDVFLVAELQHVVGLHVSTVQ